MDLKEKLLNVLRNELNEECSTVLDRNISKRPIVLENIDLDYRQYEFEHFKRKSKHIAYASPPHFDHAHKHHYNYFSIVFILVIISVIGLPLYLGGKFLSNVFNLNIFISILIVFAILIVAILVTYLITKLSKYIYKIFDRRLNSIQPKNIEVKDDFNDDVYFIISSTYETLCSFKEERERQAKLSFNVALILITVGVLIVLFGIFLLYEKNILGGLSTSITGSISGIIGGTIIKLYNNANDRMDKLNANLFTLNHAKVQYALILKISDDKKRNLELSKLIQSIGNITNDKNKLYSIKK